MFGEVVKYYFKKLVHRGCTPPPLADEFYAEKQVAYLGVPITSAHSSDTDMTVCSTVLQGGNRACQCHVNFCSVVYQLLQTEQAVQTRI